MSTCQCVQLRPPVLVILGFLIPWTHRHFLLSKAKSPDEPVSHAVESYSVGLLIISIAEKNATKGQRAELLQLPCQVCVLTQQILQTPGLPGFFLVFLLWPVQCGQRCAWGLRWAGLWEIRLCSEQSSNRLELEYTYLYPRIKILKWRMGHYQTWTGRLNSLHILGGNARKISLQAVQHVGLRQNLGPVFWI